MKINFRSGSALLIVLGMLSFMVISAIGFSVFMRQNRLPSSFVRRNTTAHQLLNAALARAMNELDSAIGDDPFPGVDSGNEHGTRLLKGTANRYIDDTWKGRVFVGKIRSRYEANINTNSTEVLIPHDDTVSTLTMEGLAYLPPCLVNEARYFSRHTPTAQWKMLAYDAGRYAYTAINVSDYFDINNIPFAEPRTYSPSNRVSLAYLFGSDPKQADKFHSDIVDSYGPFVSLADFNLVMFDHIGNAKAQEEKYGFVSPFGDYASGNGRFDHYFGNANTNSIAKTTFVTESYFPEEEVSEDLLDLNEDDCQPFGSYSKKNIQQVYKDAQGRSFYKAFQKEYKIDLSAPTLANLYDYLDEDSLPVSLAVPSVEQVPVIAGYEVKQCGPIKVSFNREIIETDFDPSTGTKDQIGHNKVKYTLNYDASNLQIDVTTLFPFTQAQATGFEVSAAAHIFWGPAGSDTTAEGVCQAMNMQGGSPQKSEDDLVVHGLFTEKNKEEDGGFDEFNRFTFKPAKQSAGGGYAENPEDALHVTSLSLSAANKAGSVPFAIVNETWLYQKASEMSAGFWVHTGSKIDAANGDVRGIFDSKHAKTGSENALYKPYLAIRFMVKNSEGVVDLAPACGWDDVHNFGSVPAAVSPYLDMNRAAFIIPTNGAEIRYSAEDLQGYIQGIAFANTEKKNELSFMINDSSRVCKDPKWNHNVFNWSVVNKSIKDDIIDTFKGVGKDSDFFQGASDSEWLQSVAELAMLPRTMDFSEGSKNLTGSLAKGRSDDVNFAKSLPLTKKIADARGENVYLCASYDGDDKAVESLFADGTGGFRINPYSDDPNIFLAALAYTPYNWSAASPDNNWRFTKAVKHTFSESSDVPSARLTMSDLKEIASEIHEGFTSSDDWVEAYNDLGWGFANEPDIFKDYGLTSADKKYLYGFWKGCFANRQQLFIIFLRAEPSVGSGKAGAGQGGRAVAVVWRDPKEPERTGNNNNKNNNSGLDPSAPPHKMRVLFYKALE